MARSRVEADMKVLIVDASRDSEPCRDLVDTAASCMLGAGHDVQRIDLEASGFPTFMTAEERRRYHDVGDNICCPHVEASVEAVRAADAVIFGYQTTLHTVPASLKGWLERTMVPGVGFVLNENNKVRPGLASVTRVGAITTTPHGRRASLAAGDLGRRTLMRSFRANCSTRCRRTFVSVHDSQLDKGHDRVRRAFSRW